MVEVRDLHGPRKGVHGGSERKARDPDVFAEDPVHSQMVGELRFGTHVRRDAPDVFYGLTMTLPMAPREARSPNRCN